VVLAGDPKVHARVRADLEQSPTRAGATLRMVRDCDDPPVRTNHFHDGIVVAEGDLHEVTPGRDIAPLHRRYGAPERQVCARRNPGVTETGGAVTGRRRPGSRDGGRA